MRKAIIGLFFLIVVAVILGSLNFNKVFGSEGNDSMAIKKYDANTDSILDEDSVSIGNGKGLNDIRFSKFADKDWLDNEYIRCLRNYLDDYNRGKIKDGDLDPYKDKVRGKFVIGSVEPFIMGGLFIRIMFIDNPEDIFSVWVYSSIDESTETIVDYSVHGIKHDDEKSGFTKEEVLGLLKGHPEQKMW